MSQHAVRGCDDLYRINPFEMTKVWPHTDSARCAEWVEPQRHRLVWTRANGA